MTKYIIDYIKKKELQNKTDRRKINTDKTLKNLLNITEEEELTYFNLQKYTKKIRN